MKEGCYAMNLSAGAHNGSGQVSLKKHMLIGRDRCFILSGQIAEAGECLIGSVLVIPVAGAPIDTQIHGDFLVAVTGIAAQESFMLTGVGPLGLIVEVTGIWLDPLQDAMMVH